nr:hypothetical protein [Actinokineospora terrae]
MRPGREPPSPSRPPRQRGPPHPRVPLRRQPRPQPRQLHLDLIKPDIEPDPGAPTASGTAFPPGCRFAPDPVAIKIDGNAVDLGAVAAPGGANDITLERGVTAVSSAGVATDRAHRLGGAACWAFTAPNLGVGALPSHATTRPDAVGPARAAAATGGVGTTGGVGRLTHGLVGRRGGRAVGAGRGGGCAGYGHVVVQRGVGSV